ncbi:hypothetical protein [Pseudanabaena sp. lw0831]|uniref:hypothetical protein n=1 Tax=Pseudanabaena sp. lw0831 TaxID=1357935 RepID=UPI00191581B0|nr:hypothetical protein [Pseudanabaena sp. lw0831]
MLDSNSHIEIGFQKTDFGVSSAFGAGNTKIGFIMRIAGYYSNVNKTQKMGGGAKHRHPSFGF